MKQVRLLKLIRSCLKLKAKYMKKKKVREKKEKRRRAFEQICIKQHEINTYW